VLQTDEAWGDEIVAILSGSRTPRSTPAIKPRESIGALYLCADQ